MLQFYGQHIFCYLFLILSYKKQTNFKNCNETMFSISSLYPVQRYKDREICYFAIPPFFEESVIRNHFHLQHKQLEKRLLLNLHLLCYYFQYCFLISLLIPDFVFTINFATTTPIPKTPSLEETQESVLLEVKDLDINKVIFSDCFSLFC